MKQEFIIPKTWIEILWDEFKKEYFKEIKKQIELDLNIWITIYPSFSNIFSAFEITNFEDIKVVILWQDPYHWENQANWLCFSVQEWQKLPPSLKNIFKELNSDLWFAIPKNWNLEKWAKSWVFLLNSILTVKAWNPASHSKIWWEIFTDKVIETISNKKSWIIFILWWNFAKNKKWLIDTSKHFIIEATHPSPFSAYNWFFWSKPFSKTNEILKKLWKKEIEWNL